MYHCTNIFDKWSPDVAQEKKIERMKQEISSSISLGDGYMGIFFYSIN